MRMPRPLTRRPRPAALLAAGLATALLGAAAALGPSPDADARSAAPFPRPAATAHVDTATGTADMVAAYIGGWKAGVADLGDGTKPTYPNVVGDGADPGTVAWTDGWIDGQADALGDDNRDGVVDEDESGWNCGRMGNQACGARRDASRTSR
ncbi:hypothetical protein [Streptomyces mirabilis]|uniref:hypothetical protein n=1 Tax=Streptomyces mirabilis TaxID=68239 RepID=UPI003808E521